ncbi:MAG: hypothetical protein ACREOD_10310 [Candidatus Dormibacteria bacterium]
MRALSLALVRLYPADWRFRFRGELAEALQASPSTPAVVLDLVVAAASAWAHPLPEFQCSAHSRTQARRSRRVASAAVLASVSALATLAALSTAWGLQAPATPSVPVGRLEVSGWVQGTLGGSVHCAAHGGVVTMQGQVADAHLAVRLSGLKPDQRVFYPSLDRGVRDDVKVQLVEPGGSASDYQAVLTDGLGTLNTAPNGASGSFQVSPSPVGGAALPEKMGPNPWVGATQPNTIYLSGTWRCG